MIGYPVLRGQCHCANQYFTGYLFDDVILTTPLYVYSCTLWKQEQSWLSLWLSWLYEPRNFTERRQHQTEKRKDQMFGYFCHRLLVSQFWLHLATRTSVVIRTKELVQREENIRQSTGKIWVTLSFTRLVTSVTGCLFCSWLHLAKPDAESGRITWVYLWIQPHKLYKLTVEGWKTTFFFKVKSRKTDYGQNLKGANYWVVNLQTWNCSRTK